MRYTVEVLSMYKAGIPSLEYLVYEYSGESKRLIASFFRRREAERYCEWRERAEAK